MTQSGQVVEVRLDARGSQLVGDHASGVTAVLVADPTPFDDNGGQITIDGTVYSILDVTPVDDPTEPGGTNATLTLDIGLVSAEADTTPVWLWSGTQVLDDVTLVVDPLVEGGSPVAIPATSTQRKDWAALEGTVDPPIAVTYADDLSQVYDAPGYTPTLSAPAFESAASGPRWAMGTTMPVPGPDLITSVDWKAYTASLEETEPGSLAVQLYRHIVGGLTNIEELRTILSSPESGTSPAAELALVSDTINFVSQILLTATAGLVLNGGTPLKALGFDNVAAGATAGAGGAFTLTHNLGVVPEYLNVTPNNSALVAVADLSSATTTTVTVFVRSLSTGASVANPTAVGAYRWLGLA